MGARARDRMGTQTDFNFVQRFVQSCQLIFVEGRERELPWRKQLDVVHLVITLPL
jgi:hypothetical protein